MVNIYKILKNVIYAINKIILFINKLLKRKYLEKNNLKWHFALYYINVSTQIKDTHLLRK